MTIVLAGQNVNDLHKHKCAACGTIWEHEDLVLLTMGRCTADEYHKAHNCPKCGRNERDRYWANETEKKLYYLSLSDEVFMKRMVIGLIQVLSS